MKLELKKIGNSTGLILPKELLARMKLDQGDWLYVTELPEGGIKIDAYDPKHAEAMDAARDLFKEYRDTFRALAK